MRIVVETTRSEYSDGDAEFCGDCKLYDIEREECLPFSADLKYRECRRLRCDECKAAEVTNGILRKWVDFG